MKKSRSQQNRTESNRRRSTAPTSIAKALTSFSPAYWMVGLLFGLAALSLLFVQPAGATTTELEGDAYAYGFVSRVEGAALLAGIEGNETIDAEVNHPLLTGDQVITNSGRMELVLPDGTAIRLGPGTIAIFDSIEGAPDSELDDGTVITLEKGELQIRTAEAFLAAEDLAVVTANATTYLTAPGTYRLTAEGEGYTQVVVREGFAEAETRTGSGIARDGEALEISGLSRPFVNVAVAGPADSLELWAGDLDRAAQETPVEDVDPRLAYAAAPLEGAGEWIYVESRRAWRPYVRADWRPFRYGRWVYTPSGLTWVASAPWGWVTSHYGFWDFVPGYGWLWLPGNTYMPAGVYWYWGPTHVAWVPWGYYNRYSRAGFGIYGWAGGDWGYWGQWTFCPTRYFGRRGYDRYWDTGRDMARERRFAVPRGIVTTDTRGLGPERWGKPTEALDHLVRRAKGANLGRDLPDVTDFVAGKRSLAAGSGTRAIGGNSSRGTTSKADRLRPLPEERDRARFGTRSVATSRGGTKIDSTRIGGSNRTLEPRRSTGSSRSSAGTRSGGTIRVGSGSESSRSKSGGSRSVLPRGSGGVERSTPDTRDPGRSAVGGRSRSDSDESGVDSGAKVRSVAGSRVGTRDRIPERQPDASGAASGLDRSIKESPETPVRRILDRIRAHRESARGSSSGSRGSSATESRGRSGSVSKGSSGSSARSSGSSSSSRGSGSSTRSSGSGGSSVQKASPPSRSSGNRSSSGGSNRARSRGKN